MAVHLFAGEEYYPAPGLGDYCGPFENATEAIKAGEGILDRKQGDWYAVVEEHDGRLVTLAHKYRGA